MSSGAEPIDQQPRKGNSVELCTEENDATDMPLPERDGASI